MIILYAFIHIIVAGVGTALTIMNFQDLSSVARVASFVYLFMMLMSAIGIFGRRAKLRNRLSDTLSADSGKAQYLTTFSWLTVYTLFARLVPLLDLHYEWWEVLPKGRHWLPGKPYLPGEG